MQSYSCRGAVPATVVVAVVAMVLLVGLVPASAAAQSDDLSAACAGAPGPFAGECNLSAAAVRLIHPRVGLALFGGSPVPGTASTLGMRLGSMPRLSVSGRTVLLPIELPPLSDRVVNQPPMPGRTAGEGVRALAFGLSGQTTVGLLSGWSPLPTVGGVFSVDAIARASWLHLPGGQGFHDNNVLGASLGVRLGALRESFTLPGVSITGSYGRSTSVTFGEPRDPDSGHINSGVGNWNVTGAVTKRIGAVGLTGGAALDRYTGDVEFSYVGGPLVGERADAATDRWAVFANASWTFLILHATLEAGWQESPVPGGTPPDMDLNPTGWWVGTAIRMSI